MIEYLPWTKDFNIKCDCCGKEKKYIGEWDLCVDMARQEGFLDAMNSQFCSEECFKKYKEGKDEGRAKP